MAALGDCFSNRSSGGRRILGGEDVGYLERRLDDGRGLGALAMRSRVKGAEGEWGRLQLYQRVE